MKYAVKHIFDTVGGDKAMRLEKICKPSEILGSPMACGLVYMAAALSL